MADAKKTPVMEWRHDETPYEKHVWAMIQEHWLPLLAKDGNRPDFTPKSFRGDNVILNVTDISYGGATLAVMAPSPEPVVHTVQFTAIMDDGPAAQELARKMIARMQENKK